MSLRPRPWAVLGVLAAGFVSDRVFKGRRSALCVLMLHDRGVVSVDAPMADYWPEFAANGKEGVLVRHVLGHTAGLPVFDKLDAQE